MESAAVIVIFDQLFGERYETYLIAGAPEPFYHYVPKGYSKIFFRSDYTSSALHEVAHWCVAGPNRRRENDYGYFYVEDRNKEQQLQFQRVERKVQALEWIFSVAANVPFQLSIDNFNDFDPLPFGREVRFSVMTLLADGLAQRALSFANALSVEVGGREFLAPINYNLIPGR